MHHPHPIIFASSFVFQMRERGLANFPKLALDGLTLHKVVLEL
jgi:hypothetical protein